jgi:16S rRNA (adenine1518-N6/adenine1519-N6)-dimethyltransferase
VADICADPGRRVRLGGGDIGDLLARHGLEPSRALGQNFVTDPNTIDKIVRVAGVERGDHVVEVGPGLGSLTLGLLDAGATVLAVEVDRHLGGPLDEVIRRAGTEAAARAEILLADAMTIDWAAALAPRHGGDWSMVANLPYNVAAPMVLRVLDEAPMIQRIVVLVQREVGERLVAGAGSGTYGIPSVKVAYWATGSVVAKVPAAVFHPVPKVDSVVVRIERRATPATDADPDLLFSLVRRAFGQRRKMLRRSLAGVVDDATFTAAGIDPATRPERLDVVAWGRLATAVAAGGGS